MYGPEHLHIYLFLVAMEEQVEQVVPTLEVVEGEMVQLGVGRTLECLVVIVVKVEVVKVEATAEEKAEAAMVEEMAVRHSPRQHSSARREAPSSGHIGSPAHKRLLLQHACVV